MGYAVQMFSEIGKLKLPVNKVLDIGAQDLILSTSGELDELNAFISIKKPKNTIQNLSFPALIEAKEIYERAGYEYTNIDVDERPGTVRVDLATFQIPRKRGQYGLVVNVGTTEHLSSPAATFALMHEMVCVGGYLFNDVPIFGSGNHGLTNVTPKFWHALFWMNRYEKLLVAVREIDESQSDRGNFYHDYLDYIKNLSNAVNISWYIRAVIQKTHKAIFVVPYDAIFPKDDGTSLAKLMAGSYFPFVSTGAYTPEEAKNGINDFLELNCLPYRVKDYAMFVQNSLANKLTGNDVKLRTQKMLQFWPRIVGKIRGIKASTDAA